MDRTEGTKPPSIAKFAVSEPGVRPAVHGELDQLMEDLEATSHMLAELEERTTMVRTPLPATQTGRDERVPKVVCSPLTERLQDMQETVRNLNSRIGAIVNCLEI